MNKRCYVLFALLFLSACVSRYDPVDEVHPLSNDCNDYAAFSKALAKQRDNGFTKRATMSMVSYSAGNEQDREILYQRYQDMLDIIFADHMIQPDTVKVVGRVICEQQQRGVWQPIKDSDLLYISGLILACDKDNITEFEMERCILSRMDALHKHNDLSAPPGYNRQ